MGVGRGLSWPGEPHLACPDACIIAPPLDYQAWRIAWTPPAAPVLRRQRLAGLVGRLGLASASHRSGACQLTAYVTQCQLGQLQGPFALRTLDVSIRRVFAAADAERVLTLPLCSSSEQKPPNL